MDDVTAPILHRLGLEHLDVVTPSELAELDPGLVEVRPTRSAVEFMWTATPAICLASFAREPALTTITYLDADLTFFSDPGAVFDEIGASPVAITPHRYSPRWETAYAESSGIFNVQWLTFTRSPEGLEALRWWRDRCLEWCRIVPEDGKFGDQKYLDDWPVRFPLTHIVEHVGAGLAPWNIDSYDIWEDPVSGEVRVDDVPLVFFHVHGLSLIDGGALMRKLGRRVGAYQATSGSGGEFVWRSGYSVAGPQRALIWERYVRDLAIAYDDIRRVEPGFDRGFTTPRGREIAGVARRRARYVAARFKAARERRQHLDWSDEEVAMQMVELSDEELREKGLVAPFRIFVEALEEILGETEDLPNPCPLLDVGCGVGAYGSVLERRFPNRFAYEGWDSSSAVVNAARRARPAHVFRVASLQEGAKAEGFEIVLASALLDVQEDFEFALDLLLASPARYVLLHRQRVTSDRTRVEKAPGYKGQTTYRSYVSYGDLAAAAADSGRRIARRYHVGADVHTFVLTRLGPRD